MQNSQYSLLNIKYFVNGHHIKQCFGLCLWFAAPEAAPRVQEKVEGRNNVNITWSELDRSQRRGCITKYTIYLETMGNPKICKDELNCSCFILLTFSEKAKVKKMRMLNRRDHINILFKSLLFQYGSRH